MPGDWKDQLSKKAEKMGMNSQKRQDPPKANKSQQFQQVAKSQVDPAGSVPNDSSSRDYVKEAETVILGLRRVDRFGNEKFDLTTSKLRNVLGLVNQIYNEVILNTEDRLSQPIQDRIKYLKVRVVYEAGRDPRVVKEFVNKARLLEKIDGIGDSRKQFLEFSRYMEALVAYHRFYGGKDN
jgi:CRISPR-associated protein Csm2